MDKSGRKTLTDNVAALIEKAGGSRLALAKALKLDVKALERVAKDAHGEKGVGIAFIDELASRLDLHAWQLLVPGLDPDHPPALASVGQAVAPPAADNFDVELLAVWLTRFTPELRETVSRALSDLARYPDSQLAIRHARNAIAHGVGIEGLPTWRDAAVELITEVRMSGKPINPETLIRDIDRVHSDRLARVSAKAAQRTMTES